MKYLMIEAFDLKSKGYYKQAIEIFYKLLAKETDQIEILSEIGNLYYLLKNYDRALNYTNKALAIDENHIESLRILKEIYIEKVDYDNAAKISNKIYLLTQEQDDLAHFIKLLNKVGKSYQATGFVDYIDSLEVGLEIANSFCSVKKYDEAIEVLENIDEAQEGTKHLELLCKIYFETKQTEKAKEVLNKLKNNNEMKDAQILNFMGLAKLDELNLDSAVEYFKQAIELSPKRDEYNFNLAQSYFLKGWYVEAKKYFLNAICYNPENLSYKYSLAYLLYREGDFKNALTHLNNELVESKVLKSLIKYQTGDLASAKIELEKLHAEQEDNETVLYALAQIYDGLELKNKGIEILNKLIELNPKSFDYKSLLYSIMIKSNQLEEVKPLIVELSEQYPQYYYSKELLAKYLYRAKEYDELFDVAQELIELDMNQYEGYYYNALALIEKNDTNFAIESLKKAITLDVNNADLYVKMAEIYQSIGKYEDAFFYINEASDIDKSAKNRELYMELASILRKKGINIKQG